MRKSFLCVLGMLLVGLSLVACDYDRPVADTTDVSPTVDLAELRSQGEDLAGREIRTSGVILAGPAKSMNGYAFTVASAAKQPGDGIRVVLSGDLPETTPGEATAAEDFVGRQVVVTGTWDGSVLHASNFVVRPDTTY